MLWVLLVPSWIPRCSRKAALRVFSILGNLVLQVGSSQTISIVPKKTGLGPAGLTARILWKTAFSSCWWNHRLSVQPSGFSGVYKRPPWSRPVHLQLCGLARICLTATPSGWMSFRRYRSRRQIFIAKQMLGISSCLTDFQVKTTNYFHFFFKI